MKRTYLTNCVNIAKKDVDALQDMIDLSKEITYKTFRNNVPKSETDRAGFGYYDDCPGLSLASDWAVRYYSSIFKGQRCYYMLHSRIEYIFT